MTATWDLSGYFDRFDGDAMRDFKTALTTDLEALQTHFDGLETLCGTTFDAWEEAVGALEEVTARLEHLFSYIECLEAAHADNEAYSKARAWLTTCQAAYEKVEVSAMAGLRQVAAADLAAFVRRPGMNGAGYHLERLHRRSRRTMAPELERLAADLSMDGLTAWGRLYDRISGNLTFEMTWPDGRREHIPIARWRSLMSDVDRAVGRAAFEGGNRAWADVGHVCAAALNAIAGTRLTLNRHRGIDHFLDAPLFEAGIGRATLDAMYGAIHARLELARDIVRTRARFLGRSGIWFFEREAPLPVEASARFPWDRGVALVAQAFEHAYPALGAYFRRFVAQRWIESAARAGKRPGAFCTHSPLTGEQRVFMTYAGALNDVTTVAHEVGHAWHAHLLKEMRPLAQHYPMTLAETASIFAECILAEGIYGMPDMAAEDRLLMLDTDLSGAAVLLLDITTRFEFERAFYEERTTGEVPLSRLKELMTAAQRRVYGDSLLEDGADPWFWASKLHFYISEVSFYNFPYTFGFLLARALVARFRREGGAFLPRYKAFLRLTGSDTAENVARRALDVDLTAEAFWLEAIDSLAEPLARFREALARRGGAAAGDAP